MQATIEKIENYSEGILVRFATEYGEGFGIWNGNKRPVEKDAYNIELDITDTLKWGKDVVLSKNNGFKIAVTESAIILTGKVEKLYSDGMVDFRLGTSLIQLELEGKGIPIGKFVDVKTNDIEVYAY